MIYFLRSRSDIDIISIRHRKFLRNLDSRNVIMMYNKINDFYDCDWSGYKSFEHIYDKSNLTFNVKFNS